MSPMSADYDCSRSFYTAGKFSRILALYAGLLLPIGLMPAVLAAQSTPPNSSAEPATPNAGTPITVKRMSILSPGDKLRISVYNADKQLEYQSELMITPAGYVVLPSVGAIKCSNKSTETLSRELTTKYRRDAMLRDAQVVVNIIGYAPRTVFVFGAVNTPREVHMPVGKPLTLSQVISAVGGFKENALITSIQVYRNDPLKEKRNIFTVNMKRVVADLDVTADIVILPGDTVYVPRAESVFVMGAVNTPGEIKLPLASNLRVSQAIAIAGGFRVDAKRTAVQLQRVNPKTGKVGIITVNMTQITEGAQIDRDIVIRPGDTIFIPESDLITVLGEVHSPGPVQTVDIGEVMSVQAAIALAGGATPSADMNAVRVVRKLNTSEVESIRVPVEETDKIQKLALKSGDIIVVPRKEGVFVLGEIARPGVYRIAPHQKLTVSHVLAAAGGFSNYAKKTRVYIFRKNPDNTIKKIELDMEKITEDGELDKDIELQPGDQVYFP